MLGELTTVRSISKLAEIMNSDQTQLTLKLEIFYRDVTLEEVAVICEALKRNWLHSLKFADCDQFQLTPELQAAIKTSTSLIHLELPGNKITGNTIVQLSDILSTNTSLLTLNLCHNSLTDTDLEVLSTSLRLNQTLTLLNLSGNKFSNIGITHLNDMMRRNNTLEEIKLEFNASIQSESIMQQQKNTLN